MRIAVVGSRNLQPDDECLASYLADADEIVSGGAAGVDTCAAHYAKRNGIPLKEFLPNYNRYGRGAPLVRNREIVHYADKIVVFWDGVSRGSRFVIQYAEKMHKECAVILLSAER